VGLSLSLVIVENLSTKFALSGVERISDLEDLLQDQEAMIA
jgi:hypothetical protein